jgi:hypothetical protein
MSIKNLETLLHPMLFCLAALQIVSRVANSPLRQQINVLPQHWLAAVISHRKLATTQLKRAYQNNKEVKNNKVTL